MSKELTVDDFKESLNAHIAERGAEIRARYGPRIGWGELQAILSDRWAVRYPCEIVFEAGALQEGEFSHAAPNGESPEAGFKIFVHPSFLSRLEIVPELVLYQLVLVNYGPFASPDDAETLGAAVLGIAKDEYYERLCRYADELSSRCGCGPG